jgi:hypothetical protein
MEEVIKRWMPPNQLWKPYDDNEQGLKYRIYYTFKMEKKRKQWKEWSMCIDVFICKALHIIYDKNERL